MKKKKKFNVNTFGILICLMVIFFNVTAFYRRFVPDNVKISVERLFNRYYDPKKPISHYVVKVEHIVETSLKSDEGPVFFIQHDHGISVLESNRPHLFNELLALPKEERYLLVNSVPAFALGYREMIANIPSNLRIAFEKEYALVSDQFSGQEHQKKLIVQQYLTMSMKHEFNASEMLFAVIAFGGLMYFVWKMRKQKGRK